MDPNPAMYAYAAFPQSGHIRPGKTAIFPKFSIFFPIRTNKKIRTAHRGPICQIKAHEKSYHMQKTVFSFDK